VSYPLEFGRYRLLERLAVGGMAEVFRATTSGAGGFEKDVVIKRVLHVHSRDRAFLDMFFDEAKIAARLQHPNIVQVFDFDEIGGTHYIAMEYVQGADLRGVLERLYARGDRLDLAEAIYVASAVAKALDYAHTRSYRGRPLEIVHRDVSPHNVLISFDGVVKLADFGIAKAVSRITHTQEGIVKGKTAYMSPEQARGADLDGRSDLFALGTVLYEMVAMRRLFNGETERDILLKVMDADVPSPRSYCADLPYEVEGIIMRLLERRVDRRYQTAAEVVVALDTAYRAIARTTAEMTIRARLASLYPERNPRNIEAPVNAALLPQYGPPPGTPVGSATGTPSGRWADSGRDSDLPPRGAASNPGGRGSDPGARAPSDPALRGATAFVSGRGGATLLAEGPYAERGGDLRLRRASGEHRPIEPELGDDDLDPGPTVINEPLSREVQDARRRSGEWRPPDDAPQPHGQAAAARAPAGPSLHEAQTRLHQPHSHAQTEPGQATRFIATPRPPMARAHVVLWVAVAAVVVLSIVAAVLILTSE
jgi:serine/threonine protein kinase